MKHPKATTEEDRLDTSSVFSCLVELKSLTQTHDNLLSDALAATPLTSEMTNKTIDAALHAGEGEFDQTAEFLALTAETCHPQRVTKPLCTTTLLSRLSEDKTLSQEYQTRLAAPQKLDAKLSELLKAEHPGEHREHDLVQGILEKTSHYLDPVVDISGEFSGEETDLDQLVHDALSAPSLPANFMRELKAQVKSTVNEAFEPLATLDLTPASVIRDTIADSYLFESIYADASQDYQASELHEAQKSYQGGPLTFHNHLETRDLSIDDDAGSQNWAVRLVTSRSFGTAAAMIALGAWLGVWMTGASILKNSYQLASVQQTQTQIENTLERVSSVSDKSELSELIEMPVLKAEETQPATDIQQYDPQQMQTLFNAIESLDEWPLEISLPS